MCLRAPSGLEFDIRNEEIRRGLTQINACKQSDRKKERQAQYRAAAETAAYKPIEH